MELVRQYLGKVSYGVFFCVVVPAVLWLWAVSFDVPLPVVHWEISGVVISATGVLLVLSGMWNLWHYGKGLPMNAFPPRRYVSRGAYTLFRHPIYTGFCFAVAGFSLFFGSASGLYVVTPVITLLCIALVMGFEQPDLLQRFGAVKHPVIFGLPEASQTSPGWLHKFAAVLIAFLPWLVLYELVIFVGVMPGSVDTAMSFEKTLPVIEWMELPYFLTYPFVVFAPFMVRSMSALRAFILDTWVLTAAGIFLQIVLPLHAGARAFEPQTVWGEIILWEISMDGPAGAFPSFHVIWALFAFTVWAERFPRYRLVLTAFTGLIILSCIGIGVHSAADVVGGLLTFMGVTHRQQVWRWLNRTCEKLANSWTAHYLGNLRVINHSVYAGLAAAVGVMIASMFAVPVKVLWVVMLSSVAGGAVWGQFFEGSSKLLRPFGYYGALLGGVAGVLISGLAGYAPVFQTLAAFALASPLTQAIGRLRCLVQGCCHGALTHGAGIRYSNEHSRVCRISHLKGRVLHNTQLYSIACNLVIFLVLWRMWYAGASPSAIAGFYFILSGIARFVEEAFRGEVQTVIVKGLRLYQWLAVASVLGGVLVTCLTSGSQPAFTPVSGAPEMIVIISSGLVWAFGMGMDFPSSNVPYSRLSD
jgi:protein-S-isoprenylcysteine O-methyltransferase Ste14